MAREATEAGLTGQYEGGATVQEQNRLDALQTQDLQRRLATAGATGQLDLGGSQRPITTLAAQAQQDQLESSKQNRLIQEAGVTGLYDDEATLQADALAEEQKSQTLERALQRAGATGKFLEEGDTGEGQDTLENRLRTAQLTGRLGDEDDGTATIAGRQADMDLIGAILASQDKNVQMTDAQKSKFGSALSGSMTAMDPYQRQQLRGALGGLEAQPGDKERFAAEQRAAQEPILASLNFTPEERAMFFDRGMDVTTIMDLRDQ